jgi:hypothetical protein
MFSFSLSLLGLGVPPLELYPRPFCFSYFSVWTEILLSLPPVFLGLQSMHYHTQLFFEMGSRYLFC